MSRLLCPEERKALGEVHRERGKDDGEELEGEEDERGEERGGGEGELVGKCVLKSSGQGEGVVEV